jgi:hypothetical protein
MKTKIPTIEEMEDKLDALYKNDDKAGRIRTLVRCELNAQRNNVHAIATELEARLNVANESLGDEVTQQQLAYNAGVHAEAVRGKAENERLKADCDDRIHAMELKMNDGWGAAQEAEHKLERIEKAIREGEEHVCGTGDDGATSPNVYAGIKEAFNYMKSILEQENTDGEG